METMGLMLILAAASVLLTVAFVTAVVQLFRTKARHASLTVERDRLALELDQLRQTLAVKEESFALRLAEKDIACANLIKARIEEKDKACEMLVSESERSFAKTVETLREQFSNLAVEALRTQRIDLSDLNKSQIELVLKPLREQVQQLQVATQKAESERVTLKNSISENVGAIESIAKNLEKTATALSSDTKVQGRRGEEILEEKLRQAGLEEGVSFFLQDGTRTDRPDAQVCDPQNRWFVIDSKVSLTAYLEYANAHDEETKKAKLAAHVASVRGKIDELARRKYPQALRVEFPERSYLDVTVMFVPYEAPLIAALRAEPSLWQFAAENNVVIVTPLTLVAFTRLVYLAWQQEKAVANQVAIIGVAQELLSRLNSFLMAFERVGKAIDDLGSAYGDARKVIVDAPHAQTISKSATKLISLGVKLESRKGVRMTKAKCLLDKSS